MRAPDLERFFRLLRRSLLAVVLVPLSAALGLTLIDAYRSRGKRPKPFPVTAPRTTEVGEGSITTYSYGRDLYDDMLRAIEGAQKVVLFESYIWKGDEVGQLFKTALAEAAARGVEVYCVFDSFANLVVPPRFKQMPPGIKVLRYPVYPAGLRFYDLRRYGRDHRKILVVDDTAAFIGGYNIGSAYATEWRDTHLRITGPGVVDLKRAFADFWNLNRRKRLGASQPPLLIEAPSAWDATVRFHRNVPRLMMFPIRAMYLEAINRASTNVWLTTAYFLPDQDFVDALKDAAQRGVDVRVLLPLKSNHIVTDWISRGYFAQLLEAGVRIFRFRDAMIHAKTATVDGSWTTVGTANIDRLSLSGNYEINVEIIDHDLAAAMEEIFATDCSNSLELTEHEWQARDMHRKFTEFVLTPLRPFL
ncbi:phospholipase D-like domain-containing protein [Nocardioides nematodiphilus]|uniref:phospholipase D-like domain-containing protein n=1 Tax=Nocardioides nematodiphilus TaxID=2849669 RepID=UPI001CD9DCFB|nr:phospholipase D-like domain-containing protein [Nocardioides nematodiphilus]MCA1982683.1 phospholipase D-like domain-containing protein [Nocardioides nematodiphilus]